MDFLQMVNRARSECTDKGSDLTTLQSGLVVEDRRFVGWVDESWQEVQMLHPQWSWMRKTAVFDTAAAQASYTGATDVAEWQRGTFRAWNKTIGTADEQILPFMEYETWRNVYAFGAMRSQQGRPVAVTVAPDHSLSIGPLPDRVYTVTGDYWRAPSSLVLDADTPTTGGLPERFHMLMVYGAMQKFAAHEAAPEVYARAERSHKQLKNQLFAWGLPAYVAGPPLA